jgi:hypothetical protein
VASLARTASPALTTSPAPTTPTLSFPTSRLTLMLLGMMLIFSICLLWSFGFFASWTSQTLAASAHQQSTKMDDKVSLAATSTTLAPAKGPPPPLIAKRTMYTAGYDARQNVQPNPNPYISWQWTAKTQQYFSNLYNSVMHPTTCNTDPLQQGNYSILMAKQGWGVGSRIRDTVDIILEALDLNRTALHTGTMTKCPFLTNNTTVVDFEHGTTSETDPYMECLFETFSSCQGISPVDQLVGAGRGYDLFSNEPGRQYGRGNLEKAIHNWWQEFLQHGLYAMQYGSNATIQPKRLLTPPEASLDEKYSVLRALIAHRIFAPSRTTPWVQQRVLELEQQALNTSLLQPPTLVVHLRRTDKANDGAHMYPHEIRSSIPETLVVVRALIRAAQRMHPLPFQSIFFMSDEPQAFLPENLEYLSSTLPQCPSIFYNDFVQKALSNHSDYKEKGHGVFTNTLKHEIMDRELVASMSFASRHASYVIGNGRSGISQLMAQLVGAKYHMCPSQLSLFEDDIVLLRDLEETKDWSWYIEGNVRRRKL